MARPHDPDADLTGWTPPPPPDRATLEGRYALLEPLDPHAHAAPLHAVFAGHDRLWDHMAYGPFADAAAYAEWMRGTAMGADPLFLAILDRATRAPGGLAAWLRVQPAMGTIELGHICLSPGLSRSRVATEAFFLMIDRAFVLGYRRVEWKCNARNLASRRAAQRLGFGFEGVHRQHMVIKHRNRDTAWFSILAADWADLRGAYADWLDPANFDAAGCQRRALSSMTAPMAPLPDPALR